MNTRYIYRWVIFIIIFTLIDSGYTDSKIELQLNTEGATSRVRSLLLNKDESLLVSAGDDKVVRIWDTSNNQLIREIRGQVDYGLSGAVNGMALSPNDKWLVVSGFYPHQYNEINRRGFLRIYDFSNGKLVKTLDGYETAIQSLVFSADGSMLVGGESLHYEPKVIIWDTKKWQIKNKIKGHENGISLVAFTQDKKNIITSSWDKSIRIWDIKSGKNIKTIHNAHDGRISHAVVPINSSVPLIITCGTDKKVKIWNYVTGENLHTIKFDRRIRKLYSDSNGKKVLAASSGDFANSWIAVIDINKGKVVSHYNKHNLTPTTMTISKDDNTVYSTGGFRYEIDKWTISDGRKISRLVGKGKPIQAVGISSDGNTIYWGYEPIDWSGQKYNPSKLAPLSMQIRLSNLHNQLDIPKKIDKSKNELLRKKVKLSKLSLTRSRSNVTHLHSVLEIRKGNKLMGQINRDATSGYIHTAFTFTPDGRNIVSGAEAGYLSIHKLNGEKVGDFVGHQGDITDLTISKDGKILVSGSRDQTFRIWSVKNQELLVSFFVSDDNEWIAWSPDGYYSSSPRGDQYIGWQINQGFDKEADYIKAAQLREKLYRPDIIDRIIQSRKSIHSDKNEFDLTSLADPKKRPPKFSVTSPKSGITVKDDKQDVSVAFDTGIAVLKNALFYLNGRKLDLQDKVDFFQNNSAKINFPVEGGENILRIVAKNEFGETNKSIVLYSKTPHNKKSGKLFIISIGVSDYLENQLDIYFPANDAIEFEKAVRNSALPLFDTIESIVIADSLTEPTKSNIEKVLTKLNQLTDKDSVILFIAGHGVMEMGEYYFLPKDTRMESEENITTTTAVNWKKIHRALSDSKGRRILVVDTCFAENAYNPRFVKDASDEVIIALSATDGKTLARGYKDIGHGAFTYSLLQGLSGEADSEQDNNITVNELFEYAKSFVSEKTKGKQIPVSYKPDWLRDFNFGVLN